jgi:hypothetical protein
MIKALSSADPAKRRERLFQFYRQFLLNAAKRCDRRRSQLPV